MRQHIGSSHSYGKSLRYQILCGPFATISSSRPQQPVPVADSSSDQQRSSSSSSGSGSGSGSSEPVSQPASQPSGNQPAVKTGIGSCRKKLPASGLCCAPHRTVRSILVAVRSEHAVATMLVRRIELRVPVCELHKNVCPLLPHNSNSSCCFVFCSCRVFCTLRIVCWT